MDVFAVDRLRNLKPEFFIQMGHAALNILIIILLSAVVLKLIHRALAALEKKKIVSSPFVIFSHSMLRWTILVVGILLILQQMGITLNSIWTVISAIVAMIAIGFVAVWSVLSNLLCTVMLIVFHPFRIGDEIELIDPAMTAGLGGRVRNINLMFTSLQELPEKSENRVEIMIPNNLFFQKIVRCKKGSRTFSLDKQLFEEKSFLRTQADTSAEA
ncbi:MAG: mechanosensitive ion channel [Desulfobacterales bacterium]